MGVSMTCGSEGARTATLPLSRAANKLEARRHIHWRTQSHTGTHTFLLPLNTYWKLEKKEKKNLQRLIPTFTITNSDIST